MRKQIIAMGGGPTLDPALPQLDRYFIGQTGKSNPKVCFIGTATGDADAYVLRFYQAMAALDCKPSHLPLFKRTPVDLEAFLLDHDVIYAGGGNTRSQQALWREWGLDRHLRTAWEHGVVLTGVSAGSICWFEEGVTDSMEEDLHKLKCLGFLPGSNCPHYDGEADRRPAYHRLIEHEGMLDGIAADNGVALHYVDDQLLRVVSPLSWARAYRVRGSPAGVQEEIIVPEALDAAGRVESERE